jgi:hypothetical protein
MPLKPLKPTLVKTFAALTAFSLAGLCGSVQAQTAAPVPTQAPAATPSTSPVEPSSPAKRALVSRILELQRAGIENLGSNIAAAPLLQMRQQIGQLLQQRVSADRREAVAREIEGDMRRYIEEVAPIVRDRALKVAPTTMGKMLDERFTEDELKQIVAMLESPVNRKYQSMGQDFQRSLGEQLVNDTRATIEPKLRALDQTVANRLGLNNAPPAAPAVPAAPAAPAAPRN